MSIGTIDGDGYKLLKIQGFLDGHTPESKELRAILTLPSGQIHSHYVLDLSAVEYVNSSVLGMFVQFLSSAQAGGYHVLIFKPPASVENVLALTGLAQVLPIVQNEQEIHAHFGRGPQKSFRNKDIDYNRLADEIEHIIKGYDEDQDEDSQLGRILGG